MVVKVVLIAVFCITSALSHPLGLLEVAAAAGGLANGATVVANLAKDAVGGFSNGLPGTGSAGNVNTLTNLGQTAIDAAKAATNAVSGSTKLIPGSDSGTPFDALTNLGKTATDAAGAFTWGQPGLGGQTDALTNLGKTATDAVGTVTQGLSGSGLGGQTNSLANLGKTAIDAFSGLTKGFPGIGSGAQQCNALACQIVCPGFNPICIMQHIATCAFCLVTNPTGS